MSRAVLKPRSLPCYPCPHESACCSYGATVSPREVKLIQKNHGKDKVYLTRWGEWRTRIRNKRCVFLANNACTLHARPEYPAVCKGFPYFMADGKTDYPYDQDICPDLIPDLKLLKKHTVKKSKPKSEG